MGDPVPFYLAFGTRPHTLLSHSHYHPCVAAYLSIFTWLEHILELQSCFLLAWKEDKEWCVSSLLYKGKSHIYCSVPFCLWPCTVCPEGNASPELEKRLPWPQTIIHTDNSSVSTAWGLLGQAPRWAKGKRWTRWHSGPLPTLQLCDYEIQQSFVGGNQTTQRENII